MPPATTNPNTLAQSRRFLPPAMFASVFVAAEAARPLENLSLVDASGDPLTPLFRLEPGACQCVERR